MYLIATDTVLSIVYVFGNFPPTPQNCSINLSQMSWTEFSEDKRDYRSVDLELLDWPVLIFYRQTYTVTQTIVVYRTDI